MGIIVMIAIHKPILLAHEYDIYREVLDKTFVQNIVVPSNGYHDCA